MTNPVQQALAIVKLQEQRREAQILTAAVAQKLGVKRVIGDRSEVKTWQAWADQQKIEAYPALPAAIAVFILSHAALGIDRLEKVVEAIAAVHAHMADPTLSPLVSAALNCIDPIMPPRSWDANGRALFKTLPRAVALQIVAREADRDAAVKKALNAVSTIKRKESKNGTTQQSTTAATADQIAV